jgi:hypothetical protein
VSPEQTELLRGTLDLMILKALSQNAEMHGLGISRRIEQITKGTFIVDFLRVGRIRPETSCQILPPDEGWPETTGY